ncbi:hypothetical protein [Streptomyces sp. NPDC049949]|uniref:hypothetical protein n=1 Tax=Streptomyces sp. NPDC049949 TaxID=3154627 RepID=UPI003432F2DB
MTAVAEAPLAAGNPARYAILAAALAVVVGLLCLVAWGMRLGILALLPRPVPPRLTGVRASGSGFFPRLLSAARHVSEAQGPTVVLAAAVLVVLFAAPFPWRTLPGPLLVPVAAAGLRWPPSGSATGTGSR